MASNSHLAQSRYARGREKLLFSGTPTPAYRMYQSPCQQTNKCICLCIGYSDRTLDVGVVYTRSHVKLGLTTSDENWFSEFVVIQYLILAVMAVFPYKATCREFR